MADCLFPSLSVKWLLMADLIGRGPVSPFTGTDAYPTIKKKKQKTKKTPSCATSVTNRVVKKKLKVHF